MHRTYLEHLKTCLDVLEGRVKPQGAIYERYASRTENATRRWAEATESDHINVVQEKLLSAAENNYELAKAALRDDHIRTLNQIKDECTLAGTLVRALLGDDPQKRKFAVEYINAELAACPEGIDNSEDLGIYDDPKNEYDYS